jgi:alkylhydroperoxidase family enzyme
MARIDFPDTGMEEYVDWMGSRPEIAAGMASYSDAVYNRSQLEVREREAARYTIALINDCAVCRATRAKGGPQAGVREEFYDNVAGWQASQVLTARERLAAEFAQRFALDHLAMDDDFWARLRGAYRDDEIVDLTMCCGAWLGMGRAMAVIGVRAPDEHLVI